MKIRGVISEDEYKSNDPSGSKPGILYGLGKVHKPNLSMRPILSAIGTPCHALAKFLVPILQLLTVNTYTVKDSFAFAKEIASLDCDGLHMGSLDVESLFTNIPLEETINLVANELFGGHHDCHGFSLRDISNALDLCAKHIMFLFGGHYYQQLDGVAMGSPLGPTLANAFLAHWEVKWLEDCPCEFKPVFYRRYVDDIFVLFKSATHLDKFKDYMNAWHDSMKFTSDSESRGCFPFLDVLVTKGPKKFLTSVYR